MSLKLIREANVLSTLDATALAAFKEIQKATGKATIAEIVVEAFRPGPRDYRKWLSTIVGYAKDGGIKINTKNTFADIAGATLENDPANPPVEMHAAIINKLWADYGSSRQHAKVQKLAQSQEDEEFDSVDDIDGIDDLGDTHEPGHRREGDDDDSYDAAGKFGIADRDEDEHEHDVTCPECGCKFEPEEADDEGDDELPEPEDDEYRDPDDELGSRVGGAERLGKFGKGPDGGHVGDEPLNYQEEETVRPASHRRGPMTARVGEEVNNPEAIMRRVLTAPKEHMNNALKDIEADGTAAWTAHKLPQNPHAKGSLAFRKWNSGLKKAVKTHFGLDVAPATAKPKPKKR
jgi:hypothetical protein